MKMGYPSSNVVEKVASAILLGVCRLIGLDEYYAIWDEDDKKNLDCVKTDDMAYLDHTLSIKKGFIMKPNLEDRSKYNKNLKIGK